VPPGVCFADQTTANFNNGTVGSGAFVSQIGDGTLTLNPALEQAFNGSSLPGDWSAPAWVTGGSGIVSGGMLVVDGARAGTNATYSAQRSIEFEATFANNPWQHVGLVADWDFNDAWSIFSTYTGDGNLYARTGFGQSTSLGSAYIGTPHRYRIEALAGSTRFYIDGSLVATHAAMNGNPLRPLVSDANANGTTLQVDWVRLSPNAASGVFTSRVFDAGASMNWGMVNWNGVVPTGSTMTVRVRSGNTAAPDEAWNQWASVTSGSSVGQVGQYVQYEVTLTTSDTGLNPMLYDISFDCSSTEAQVSGFVTISTPTATSEPAATATDEPVVTEEPMVTTEPTLTETPLPTAAPTETLVPSETPTETPMETLIPTEPPTATPVPTDVPTEEPPLPTAEEPAPSE
jgi:hypothetical protein